MSEKVFKLKEDYTIPAGTELVLNNEIVFSGSDKTKFAASGLTGGFQGVSMVVDANWLDNQSHLFELN